VLAESEYISIVLTDYFCSDIVATDVIERLGEFFLSMLFNNTANC
jgi:hypothetical protein